MEQASASEAAVQVHTTVMLSEADQNTFKKLGIDLTSEPVRGGLKLY